MIIYSMNYISMSITQSNIEAKLDVRSARHEVRVHVNSRYVGFLEVDKLFHWRGISWMNMIMFTN